MNLQDILYKHVNKLVFLPMITCVILFGYTHHVADQTRSFISQYDTQQLSATVEYNKAVAIGNSQRIDEIYNQVLTKTRTEFKSEHMQAWILKFRQENPDLHIPDIILDDL